tara:strand:- start:28 stop:231 length:204 start_codon:yes stop_codon:yes gene_type:complete
MKNDMEKYFKTLDETVLLMTHDITSEKAQRLFEHVLNKQHDAGPEAKYIIKQWREDRNVDEKGKPNR